VVVWTGRADGMPLPGRIGRDTALPIVLKLFERLPGEEAVRTPPPPDALIVAHNRDLPPAMRVLLPANARLRAATASLAPARSSASPTARTVASRPPKPPRILFPVAGTTLEIVPGSADIPLKAEGGTGALRWLVNGKPLPVDRFRADPLWHPDGAGRNRVTVIDTTGNSATIDVLVRVAQR
jgi:penicillin-binding protein 1C